MYKNRLASLASNFDDFCRWYSTSSFVATELTRNRIRLPNYRDCCC
ncbi:hypothetical protein GYH30_017746 [Glycine max]|nr:hypothetical protein GYH30_017746 [Glycine max]